MEDVSQRWVRLVLAVARLGDGDLKAWWGVHALDRAGSYVLANAFPRTALAAGMDLLIIAGQRRQDAILGRPSALHIFSDHLPFARIAKAWVDETKVSGSIEAFEALKRRDARGILEDISLLSGGISAAGATVAGGRLLGSLSTAEVNDSSVLDTVISQLAAAYDQEGSDFAVPYFDLTS